MDDRHPEIARIEDSHVLVVDVQERLLPVISEGEALCERARILIQGARILGVPVLLSEQYPKGLGGTVAPLLEAAAPASIPAKTSFSCFGEPDCVEALRKERRERLIVAGIETHVCILQTVLDGLAAGYKVHVVVDAVSSRAAAARERALRRLEQAGAILTDVESVFMEWLGDARHPDFKAVQGLIK